MYSYQSRIRYSELDETGHLKIESLLDYFQDCSIFHSEDIGLGVEHIRKQNLVWVLSSWQIVVDRYPAFGENVTVMTAPYDFKGFMGVRRNFMMQDSQGKRLACANTVWSLINTESGKPVKATEEMLKGYVLEPKLDMEYAPRKISMPSDAVMGNPIIIKSHHLDTNHHVNNGQYIRIAMDSLGKNFPIRQLRAEYKKQSFLNDELIPYIASPSEGISVVTLKSPQGDVCCTVELSEK